VIKPFLHMLPVNCSVVYNLAVIKPNVGFNWSLLYYNSFNFT
jgi:hypothetical protein